MKILFITATNLGDGVLTTGALDHFIRKYPQAEFTIACGPLLTSIFEPAPGTVRIIPMKKEPYAGHWRKLFAETFFKKWDIVIDMRNSALSRLLWAGERHIWSAHSETEHKIEQIGKAIGVMPPPSPTLWLSAAAKEKARTLIPDGTPVLALGAAARWPGKTWPAENFSALALQLTAAGAPMAGARIAVFAAPGEEHIARPVIDALPADRRLDAIAKTTPLEAAAALNRCALYIGNDSGLTHTAAATGIKTLGLFGPGYPALYRPWGQNAAYVSTPETVEELTGYDGYHPHNIKDSLMRSLTVTAAYDAAVELLEKQ
ncbi:MAG TPA: glycosyltransferase family 9 protein, partial [Alphaproteobacteria bacterium]|nr:glycosyltransferase family 9 protein [Alphaproteobacteria bacterium]